MKWVELNGIHINTNTIKCFWWWNGTLTIRYIDSVGLQPTIADPDKKLYTKLCHNLGIRPYESSEEV